MKVADLYQCMSGYFQSGSLRDLAPGLAVFLSKDSAKMELIISPNLTEQDREAIESGYSETLEVLKDKISEFFDPDNITQDSLEAHTLHCLSYLIASDRLEIKIALVKKGGLFHSKIYIFSDHSGQVVAHGSPNFTPAGLGRNYEHLTVNTSWGDPSQTETLRIFTEEFKQTWFNENADLKVFAFPEASKQKIIRDWHTDTKPTPEDFWDIYDPTETTVINDTIPIPHVQKVLTIPAKLDYESGDFAHQGEAVTAWEKAERRGILAMATGSGKTITSLISAERLLKHLSELLVVIAVPYIPLVNQWEIDVWKFGLRAKVPGRAKKKVEKLARVRESVNSLRFGVSKCEVLIVTHDLLCDPSFQVEMERFSDKSLLIADEVHGLGIDSFLNNPPEMFAYRLGLSATPIRQNDLDGTSGLLEYFGDLVYEFTLAQAIGKCLVPYDYFVHLVELDNDELDDWNYYTEEIQKKSWKIPRSGPWPTDLKILFNKRRLVLESARGKLDVLRGLLEDYGRFNVSHTLIYATDKDPEQLVQVNKLLGAELDIVFHQITDRETSNWHSNKQLLTQFAENNPIQVLTAKRVLDEGIDIPEITTAYILASTTIERQWTQRRGRVLRKCPSIGKQYAVIHDFIVVPSKSPGSPVSEAEKRLVQSELSRVQEFAGLSRNKTQPGGAWEVVMKLMEDYL
jgi:superfamily II DNA or RNA helicase